MIRYLFPLMLAAMLPSLTAQAADKPNVLVIISDDAGWTDFGFQDSITGVTTPVPTPRMDDLANSGVRFSNAYTASVCSPSRAMITTGMYGGRFGYESNIGSNTINPIGTVQTQGLPTEISTIWEQMQSVGYSTAAVGKWHLGGHVNNTSTGELGNRPQNQGIETFEGIIAGSRSFFAGSAAGTQALRRTTSDGAGGLVADQVIENQFSGQYVTDVFGDLTVDYIEANHDAEKPFFMYSSFTAPHTPLQATAADLNDPRIASLSGNRKTYAAMQIALDRNVGKILDALEDPNGDGNTADSIADNTLVIFMNDNGGDCCDSSPNASNNGPLRNGKGSQFEGGLRIPFVIAGAGVSPSVAGTTYDAPIHAIDVLPTAFAAGGGVFQPNETIDGKNLLPFINGEVVGDPHEALYIRRANNNQSAVRQGDWKLMYRGTDNAFSLYNLANDIDESTNVASANPEVVAQLQRVMTDFDVQMEKARYDNRALNTNQFDEFRFREGAFSASVWSASNAWVNNQTDATATLAEEDGYANAVLVFRNRNGSSYTATNDLTRIGGLDFLANRIELVGRSEPLAADGKATINGRGILLAKSLNGTGPTIALDASLVGGGEYAYDLALDISLYDDLTITGDGDESFAISGKLSEYRPGRSVTKTGSANLSIGGEVDLSGNLDLQAGTTEFTNGQVRANLINRSGASIRIGSTGIVPATGGTPGPAPDFVQAGLELNFDAARDLSGDNLWMDVADSADNLSFNSAANTSTVSTDTFPALTAAYNIPTVDGADGLSNFFEQSGPRSRQDATFEVVFNIANTSAGSDQVLIEAGGAARGVAMVLNGSDLTFNVDGDGNDINLTTTLTEGWHHAVGVIDLASGTDTVALYVDNVLVGTLAGQNVNDWSGGNPFGLGDGASSVTGVSSGSGNAYHSDIALARYYADTAFGASEVDQNFQWLLFTDNPTTGIPSVTLALDGSYTQENGSQLEIDLLDTTDFDRLVATGDAALAGGLEVTASEGFAASAGDTFEVLAAASVIGTFDSVQLPDLGEGLMWQVAYSNVAVQLSVTISGDYNGDGVVDAADYTVWRASLGQNVSESTAADGDGDGLITENDYRVWRSNYGQQVAFAAGQQASASQAAAVPEPAALSSVFVSSVLLTLRRAR